MNTEKETTFATETDTALQIAADANIASGPMAEIIDFPQRVVPETDTRPGDAIIENWGQQSAETGKIRLTERAKNIGKGTLAVAAFASALFMGNEVSSSNDKVVPTQTEIAQPGDTLWDMAGDVKNVEDRRDVVSWVKDNNPNQSDGLDAGERVEIPVDAKDIS